MTTATLATGTRTMDTAARPRRSLEELVDRLMATLFSEVMETAKPSAVRSIHEARRLRQAGDSDDDQGRDAEADVEAPGEYRQHGGGEPCAQGEHEGGEMEGEQVPSNGPTSRLPQGPIRSGGPTRGFGRRGGAARCGGRAGD